MTEILNQPTGATDLTPDELQGLKVHGITTHGELNEVEAVNIEQGLIWLERRPATFDLLTDMAAKVVHRRLFGDVWNWAGQYRLTEKNIGVQVWINQGNYGDEDNGSDAKAGQASKSPKRSYKR